jgi:hypothetical protein
MEYQLTKKLRQKTLFFVFQRISRVVFYRLHHQLLVMETVSTSETSVGFHQTTLRNIPEEKSPSRNNVIGL